MSKVSCLLYVVSRTLYFPCLVSIVSGLVSFLIYLLSCVYYLLSYISCLVSIVVFCLCLLSCVTCFLSVVFRLLSTVLYLLSCVFYLLSIVLSIISLLCVLSCILSMFDCLFFILDVWSSPTKHNPLKTCFLVICSFSFGVFLFFFSISVVNSFVKHFFQFSFFAISTSIIPIASIGIR